MNKLQKSRAALLPKNQKPYTINRDKFLIKMETEYRKFLAKNVPGITPEYINSYVLDDMNTIKDSLKMLKILRFN